MNQIPVSQKSRCRGLSLVELLISLAITATLLTATVVAIDASFRAYADAAKQASAHTTTRMVSHRLLTLIRTSTAHGPLLPDASCEPPVTLNGKTITSHFLELLDPRGDIIRAEYRADAQQLWLIRNPGTVDEQAQPLLSNVINCQFMAQRRMSESDLWVLERGTIDLSVQPETDPTLAIENGWAPPIRIVASTMPRKIE